MLANRNHTVVIHTGARDNYQVANAFSERGELGKLFTTAYYKGRLTKQIDAVCLGNRLRGHRSNVDIPEASVESYDLLEALNRLSKKMLNSQSAKNATDRLTEALFGASARAKISRIRPRTIVAYNYMAQHVLSYDYGYSPKKVLFQCHPHPAELHKIADQSPDDVVAGLAIEREISWGTDYSNALSLEHNHADVVLCASEYTKKTLIEAGSQPDKVLVAAYGVPDGWVKNRSSAKVLPSRRPVNALFVGQLVARKGVHDLIQLVTELPREAIHLKVITRGMYDPALASRLGALPNVEVVRNASKEELFGAYDQSDIFLFPSLFEGFGLVLLEAIAFGLPIVASNRTGLSTINAVCIAGLEVPAGNYPAFKEAVEELISSETVFRALSEGALGAAKHLTWRRFREAVYSHVSKEPKSPGR